jgi:hypothetical protein
MSPKVWEARQGRLLMQGNTQKGAEQISIDGIFDVEQGVKRAGGMAMMLHTHIRNRTHKNNHIRHMCPSLSFHKTRRSDALYTHHPSRLDRGVLLFCRSCKL